MAGVSQIATSAFVEKKQRNLYYGPAEDPLTGHARVGCREVRTYARLAGWQWCGVPCRWEPAAAPLPAVSRTMSVYRLCNLCPGVDTAGSEPSKGIANFGNLANPRFLPGREPLTPAEALAELATLDKKARAQPQ